MHPAEFPGHARSSRCRWILKIYGDGPLNVTAGVQQLRDNSDNRQTVFNVDFMYELRRVKLYAGWLHSQDNTGLVDTLLAEQPIPDISRLKSTNRIDDGPFTGFAWPIAAPLL